MLTPEIDLVVHATHEAGAKVGGIGAVLDGILSDAAYNRVVARTVLVGPYDPSNLTELERICAPANKFQTIYSTLDGPSDISPDLAHAFESIELYYHVNILYGKREFGGVPHEVLLIDPREVVASVENAFKFMLWERYGIDSRLYESSGEFEWFIRAAEPSFAALQALVGSGDYPRPPKLRGSRSGRAVILAHEWLGMPLAFSAVIHASSSYRTFFYAHEVASVRPLVEDHPGHDTRFYNVMSAARREDSFLEDVFGDRRTFFKHTLLTTATSFDGVLAVSDLIVDELRFVSQSFAALPISLVYNGVPCPQITPAEHDESIARMRRYGESLLGTRSDWVFTHVTRLVKSKGMWRDLRVMEELDSALAGRRETAVLYALSSAIPAGRRVEDVLHWEADYGWPLTHREGNGDLIGPEVEYYHAIQEFNRSAKASRIVLFNQYGWSPDRCGTRMPSDMKPTDIRYGTHLEFGQSIYEPFGIGQLEPLSAGALCCLSSVCGCLGFIKQSGGSALRNIVVGDYVTLPPGLSGLSMDGLLRLDQHEREAVEATESARVAQTIIESLPRTRAESEKLLADGSALSRSMSWKVVVEEGLLPVLLNSF